MTTTLRAAVRLALLALACRLHAGPAEDAAALYGDHKFGEAQAAFERLAAAEPGNAEAAYYLGLLALHRNEPEEAVRLLEKATTLAPSTARYLRALGDAYGVSAQQAGLFSKLGFARKCGAAYEQAVKLDPDNVAIRYALFSFDRQAPGIAGGGLDKARAEALEIRKRDPVQGAIALAEVSVAEKKFEEAFAVLEELHRDHPEAALADYQFGRAAAMCGAHLEEGVAALRRYLAHTPGDTEPQPWAAHWRLGQILERQGDLAGARAEFAAGLKENPAQPQLIDAMRRVEGTAAADAPAAH